MVKQKRTFFLGDGRGILARTKHKRIFGGRQTSISPNGIIFLKTGSKKIFGDGTKKNENKKESFLKRTVTIFCGE